ncbi:MAG: hypothetical protein IPN53_14770 [Comamonadaceae bacterium]|nr:hypothetical protein [Comamonadaceae bacterium]
MIAISAYLIRAGRQKYIENVQQHARQCRPKSNATPHDTGYKLLFSHPEMVRDLLIG